MSVCVCLSVSVSVSVSLSVCLRLSLSVSVCLSVFTASLSVSVCPCMSLCLSVSVSFQSCPPRIAGVQHLHQEKRMIGGVALVCSAWCQTVMTITKLVCSRCLACCAWSTPCAHPVPRGEMALSPAQLLSRRRGAPAPCDASGVV